MAFPVTVLAQNRALCRAENGSRGGVTRITEKRASVLGEELVGRVESVDFTVTEEAELG